MQNHTHDIDERIAEQTAGCRGNCASCSLQELRPQHLHVSPLKMCGTSGLIFTLPLIGAGACSFLGGTEPWSQCLFGFVGLFAGMSCAGRLVQALSRKGMA